MLKASTLCAQIISLAEADAGYVSLMANASALVYEAMDNINWAGFYIVRGEDLVLGPFQGKVACVRIPFGKGVCGTAYSQKQTVVVDDVHKFPGHIACDSASQSEIVIPLIRNDKVVAVMDIDSPVPSRFTDEDRQILEDIAKALMSAIKSFD